MTLGNYLKIHREQLGISKYELAKLSGVSAGHINNIEHGSRLAPNFFIVGKLATVLNISLDEMYDKVTEYDKKDESKFE